MRLLPSYRGGLPVTGPYDCFVGQGPQPFADTVQEGGVVAAGQIGTADALPEKHIPPDQEALRRTVKPHAAGRMPGKEQDLQLIPSPAEDTALLQEEKGPPVILEWKPPLQARCGSKFQYLLFLFVQV